MHCKQFEVQIPGDLIEHVLLEVLVPVGDRVVLDRAAGSSPGQTVCRVGRSRSRRMPEAITQSRSRWRASTKSRCQPRSCLPVVPGVPRETDLPIKTAMRQVGWHSRGHAARLFRQYVGVTSGKHRQLSVSSRSNPATAAWTDRPATREHGRPHSSVADP